MISVVLQLGYWLSGFLKEKNLALQKQKDLTVGQLLVDIDGNIWRWDGFISEDNLQRKKIIDWGGGYFEKLEFNPLPIIIK